MISLILVLPMVILAQVLGTSVGRVETNELDAVDWNGGEASLNAPERENEDSRIIGGWTAKDFVPYLASIRNAKNLNWCGGVIITQEWILSAGHCTAGIRVTQLAIVVGMKSMKGTNTGKFYRCSKIVNHKGYNGENYANDIALLKSAMKFILSANVAIIKMATELPKDKTPAQTCGLGATTYPLVRVVNPNDVQCLNTTIISTKACKEAHKNSGPAGAQITEGKQVCTYKAKGEGACKGDSGGPLTIIIDGKLYVLGITSWGSLCAKGYPDIFTAVPFHHGWITENAK